MIFTLFFFRPTQIALGCSDGSIRICADFRVDPTPYADIGRPVTRVRRLPAAGDYVSNDKTDFVGDLLLCAGHFSSLLVLQQGKVSEACLASKTLNRGRFPPNLPLPR